MKQLSLTNAQWFMSANNFEAAYVLVTEITVVLLLLLLLH